MSIEFIPLDGDVWVPHIENEYLLPYIRQNQGRWGADYDIYIFNYVDRRYELVDTAYSLERAKEFVVQKLVERKLK